MKTGLRRGSYIIDEEEIVEVLQISNARNPVFVITMATIDISKIYNNVDHSSTCIYYNQMLGVVICHKRKNYARA